MDSSEDHSHVLHHTYVPTYAYKSTLKDVDRLSISELLNLKSRIIIPRESSDHLMVSTDLDRPCQVKTEDFDVGTSALEHLLDRVKHLNSQIHMVPYDPLASKKAGLPSYTDYIQGRPNGKKTKR